MRWDGPNVAALVSSAIYFSLVLVTAVGCRAGPRDGIEDSAGGAQSGLESGGRSGPQWSEAAGILGRSCAPCHRPGGSAPFPLVTHAQVMRRRREIANVVESGFMPPWKPAPDYGSFLGERRLPAAERELLLEWLADDAPLGAAPEAVRVLTAPAATGGWRLGEPDVVLELDAAYSTLADTFEEWRCFVLPTDFNETRFLRAIEVQPSNVKAVHHLLVYADSGGEARSLTEVDGRSGLAGMCTDRVQVDDMLGGWVPGMQPRGLPPGVGLRLNAGADLVVEAHFRGTGRSEAERTRVGLTFSDEPPESSVSLLSFGAADIMLPPGVAEERISDRVQISADVEVLAILPHAHYVCSEIRAWAELPNGTLEPLIWIDDWDPDWQGFYHYAAPLELPVGTWIHTEFLYDNSVSNVRNPHLPPRRVIGGSRSTDEMASIFLQVVPSDEGGAERLAQDLIERGAEAQRIAGWWRYLVQLHDIDGDGSLDAAEEVAASAFVEGLWEERHTHLPTLDTNGDRRLDDEEEERLRSVILRWQGRQPREPGLRAPTASGSGRLAPPLVKEPR